MVLKVDNDRTCQQRPSPCIPLAIGCLERFNHFPERKGLEDSSGCRYQHNGLPEPKSRVKVLQYGLFQSGFVLLAFFRP